MVEQPSTLCTLSSTGGSDEDETSRLAQLFGVGGGDHYGREFGERCARWERRLGGEMGVDWDGRWIVR